jgi:hypothetical protein
VPTWSVRFTFRATTIGATVTAGTWSTPVNVSQNGGQGAAAPQTMIIFLYQWNAATPAAPQGTSTLNWATGKNGSYNGTDGWAVEAPPNPGTPGLRLYVATQSVTAPGGTTSTAGISYSSSAISAWTQNGNNGSNGAQAGKAVVYQWAATIPAGPSGAATYNFTNGTFGTAPNGWTLAPGTPLAGYTLWAATVSLVDTAAATTTTFNWSSAAVMAIGYAGSNGGNGQAGASYVTAYSASVTGSATSAPAATAGKTSLPAANSGGIVGTWASTVPVLTAGQYLYQTDGIYDPATGNITWSIPYWSSLKVATLSAITANLGAINAGSINLGNGVFTVDNAGNLVCSSIIIKAPDGSVVLTSGTSLASQTATGINLVPRLSDWAGARVNASLAINTADTRTKNGEFASLVGSGGTAYCGYESAPVPGIPPGAYYTISFDAACDSGTRPFAVDMFGTNVDSGGAGGMCTATWTRYKVTEQMPANGNGDARIRIYSASPGDRILVANVKVELGATPTAWTDDAISSTNSAQRVLPNSLNQTQVGGDFSSTNWNGIVGPGGQGFLLQRATGNFYGGSAFLRGSISGGAWTSFASPAAGAGTGYYVGPEGIIVGNYNDGRYVVLYSNGDMAAPGFSLVNKQLTLTNAILIAPKIGDNMSASVSPAYGSVVRASNVQFTDAYAGTFTASGNNMSGNLSFIWSAESESTQVSVSVSGSRNSQCVLYVSGRLFAGYETNIILTCMVTDVSSNVTKGGSASINVQVQ